MSAPGFQEDFNPAVLCRHFAGFVPVPPCAAGPEGQDQCGAACGSIGHSVLKIGNSLVIFITGKAGKEFWWCPHHLPHRPTLSKAGYGFSSPNSECDGLGRVVKSIDQNVIY